MFAGIDWATTEHAVCVRDEAGREVASFVVEHSSEGFEKLIKRFGSLGVPAELPVAIERPDGRLGGSVARRRVWPPGPRCRPARRACSPTWR